MCVFEGHCFQFLNRFFFHLKHFVLHVYEKHFMNKVWFDSRILLPGFLPAEVVHVRQEFLQTPDPLLGLLVWAGDEVQVLAAALEDDGEAAAFQLLLCVLL